MRFSFEVDAIKQSTLPDGLDSNEQAVYLALRNLYWLLQKGEISKEQAKEEKNKIEKAYLQRKNNYDAADNAVDIFRRAQEASTRYAKDPTIENADAFFAAVYNLKPNWRLKREVKSDAEEHICTTVDARKRVAELFHEDVDGTIVSGCDGLSSKRPGCNGKKRSGSGTIDESMSGLQCSFS